MSAPSFRLDGRVALVTGAGSATARGIAMALAEYGAGVAIAAPDPGEVESPASEIRAAGGRTLTLALEPTRTETIRPAVERLLEHFGRLDILVNLASATHAQAAEAVSREAWLAVLDANLKGLFFLSQAVAREMIARGEGGRIINVGSQWSLVGRRLLATDCASHGGLSQLTRVLALEWAQHGITVNTVAPTFTEPPSGSPEELVARIPLGRLATPEDIPGAVIFLASPAAAMITGVTLPIDGGWTAR